VAALCNQIRCRARRGGVGSGDFKGGVWFARHVAQQKLQLSRLAAEQRLEIEKYVVFRVVFRPGPRRQRGEVGEFHNIAAAAHLLHSKVAPKPLEDSVDAALA
jgi:hypothetical protein